MAGRIIKITLEDTHPPIWRRIVIPDHITFRDLHELIQILFGWEGYHLHCFENRNQGFMVDCMENMEPMSEDSEEILLVDDYIEKLPWIRYIYDFGDDWVHKIVYEKTDPSYNSRHASLIKYKGDNPVEDCGGVGPWMEFSEFDPIYTQKALEALAIPKRKKQKMKQRTKSTRNQEFGFDNTMEEVQSMFFEELFKKVRQDVPELKNAKDDDIMNMMAHALQLAEEGKSIAGYVIGFNDTYLQEQMDLMESGKPLTIVQSKKKLKKHLEFMSPETIADYLKYSRLERDGKTTPEAAFADHLLSHVNTLYYLFEKEQLEDLLSFWDYFHSGQNTIEGEYLTAIEKGICLGLIKLTGKRKLKLELCAEFDQMLMRIDRKKLKSVYSQIEEQVKTIGTLLMAYVAMSFDQFYEIYAQYAKKPMTRLEFERFVYWNGTMNEQINTFDNNDTGLHYMALPGMKQYLADLEARDLSKLFEIEPRELSQIELKKWSKGLNAALPEWDEIVAKIDNDGPIADQIIFESYMEVASGMTMTELILSALEDQEMIGEYDIHEEDWFEMECDLWHTYAKLCLVTPIMGLNGYSRQQYAEKFQQPIDYIPLFDTSILKKRITKHTHIFEFPRDIQIEMIEAMQRGQAAYENTIRRLSQKYRSSLALQMELFAIANEEIAQRDPSFVEKINDTNIIYPWDMDNLNIPKPETFVRENKKIGRNEPCPCGSGRKYKHCCGR